MFFPSCRCQVLAAIEATVPGAGERILTLVEKQFEHRCKQEMIAVEQQTKQQDEDNKIRMTGIAVGFFVWLYTGSGLTQARASTKDRNSDLPRKRTL